MSDTNDKASGPPLGGPEGPEKPSGGSQSMKVPDPSAGAAHSVRVPLEPRAAPPRPATPAAEAAPVVAKPAPAAGPVQAAAPAPAVVPAPAEAPTTPPAAAAPPATPAAPASQGVGDAPAAPVAAKAASTAAAPVKKPPTPPAPQIPRNPGAAARLAKAATIVADKEQEPLAGSADLGWNVLNVVMTIGMIALGIIALVSCARAIGALFGLLGSAPQ